MAWITKSTYIIVGATVKVALTFLINGTGIILRMQFNRIFLTLFLAMGMTACASFGTVSTPTPSAPTATPLPPSPTPPPSAAVVNGEYITIAEFEAEVARFQNAIAAQGLSLPDDEAGTIVLDDMIAQVLLSQAAREENFEVTEADLQSRIDALVSQVGGAEAFNQWLSTNGYDEASFRVSLKRSVEAAWMRDNIIAGVPTSAEQIQLRQILTYNEADAQAALAELSAGADFDELATRYDPVTNGDLGWVPQGYLLNANADAAVFALQAGEVSGIVTTEAGFHIFKAIARQEHPLSPDALLATQEAALKQWVAEQRETREIVLSQ